MYCCYSASVAAVFILDDETGAEIRFQRSVINSSSEYRINNNVSIFFIHSGVCLTEQCIFEFVCTA